MNAVMLAEWPARPAGRAPDEHRACELNGLPIGRPPVALAALAGVPTDEPVAVAAAAGIDAAPPRAARKSSGTSSRPTTRLARRLIGNRRARLAFLDQLCRTGDPALAADALGLSLTQLFRMRETDAEFAAQWQAALGFAWERVEHRVLATLLAEVEAAGDGADGRSGKRSGLLDSRLVLAILSRRDAAVRVTGRPVDAPHVARLRAELRALAGTLPNSR